MEKQPLQWGASYNNQESWPTGKRGDSSNGEGLQERERPKDTHHVAREFVMNP